VIEGVTADFLSACAIEVEPTAERLVEIVSSYTVLDCAIKWRQLTFAVGGDFDHWVCAIAATKRSAALVVHFGSLFERPEFESTESKFTRRITYRPGVEVNDDLIREVVAEAIETLPRFQRVVAHR